MILLEAFQTLGAAIGTVTGLFLIADRVYRHSPVAFVVARGTSPKRLFLLLSNKSDRPIVVSWSTGIRNNEFNVKRDDLAISSVITVYDGHYAIAIDGNEEKVLPLSLPPNWEELDLRGEIVKELRWRFAQPRFYKGVRSINIKIDKKSLLLLQDELLDGEYHDADGRAV